MTEHGLGMIKLG